MVSGRRTFCVSGSEKAESPAAKASREKLMLGRGGHTSSRTMIRGDTDPPIRARKEQ